MRVAADVPAANERILRFFGPIRFCSRQLVEARRNRREEWFVRPAGKDWDRECAGAGAREIEKEPGFWQRSFCFFGVKLFAFGEGLFSELRDDTGEGVESFEGGIGIAGEGEGLDLEEALECFGEGQVGIRRVVEQIGGGLVVLVFEAFGFALFVAFANWLRPDLLILKFMPSGGAWARSLARAREVC
jgi:hypothetical protein